MPRVSKKRALEDKYYYAFLEDFYSSITSLKNKDEVKLFLKDLLTKEELLMLAKRFQAGMMLVAGYTQQEVDRQVKVTQSTVSRIENILEMGRGGLLTICKRILNLKTKTYKERHTMFSNTTPESELLKGAILYGIERTTKLITDKKKRDSILE